MVKHLAICSFSIYFNNTPGLEVMTMNVTKWEALYGQVQRATVVETSAG
jgi:hypothetical protein